MLASWASAARHQLARLPLPITSSLILALLVGPGTFLLRSPRPQARGLERVLSASALLQSFDADPLRPVPELWRQRLGESAARSIWGQQNQRWWQFWGRHGDAGLYLVLPARAFSVAALPLPPQSLRVDELVVVAPDPLARQLLLEPFALRHRQPRGLEQRCVGRLRMAQAVYWSDTALGVLLGPLSPLLQRFQQGCLTLGSERSSLTWEGEAAASVGLLADAPPAVVGSAQELKPLGESVLLELRGSRLEWLLQGLLSRQLVKEPLAARYGIGEGQLPLLRRSPFLLRLRPQPSGPFQTSLELQLAVGADRKAWAALLLPLRKALLDQGLMEGPPQIRSSTSADVLPTSSWRREDGTVVGGWRWVSPARSPEPQLLFFLGPEPEASADPTGSWADARPLGGSGFSLQIRPLTLGQRGLLPPSLPALVKGSSQLVMLSGSGSAGEQPGRISSLRGFLRWAPVEVQTQQAPQQAR